MGFDGMPGDFGAMFFDDFAHDGESQSGSAAFSACDEGVKKGARDGGGDAGAVVLDGDVDVGVVGISGNEDVAVLIDGFEGVFDEVDENALDFVGVTYQGAAEEFVAGEFDVAALGLGVEERAGFGEDVVKGSGALENGGLSASELKDFGAHVSQGVDLAVDDLCELRAALGVLLGDQKFDVSGDVGQRGFHVVQQGGHHLADGGEPPEFFLGFAVDVGGDEGGDVGSEEGGVFGVGGRKDIGIGTGGTKNERAKGRVFVHKRGDEEGAQGRPEPAGSLFGEGFDFASRQFEAIALPDDGAKKIRTPHHEFIFCANFIRIGRFF